MALISVKAHRWFTLALGDEPGSRLTVRRSVSVSRNTLLSLVQATELQPPPSPQVVGTDDWARRRGQRFRRWLAHRRTVLSHSRMSASLPGASSV